MNREVTTDSEEQTTHNFSEDETIVLFGTKQARWFQVAAKNGVEDALLAKMMRILIRQPTGTGKTITSGLVFSSPIVRQALGIKTNRKLRLLFIAHKHCLLTQAEKVYADAMNVEFIPHSAFQPIPTGSKWDIACIDECHHESMNSIQLLLDRLGNKPIIGMTATDKRADGLIIKFDTIIEPITREQAVEQGYLARTYLNSIVDYPSNDKVPVTKMILDKYDKEFQQTIMFFRTKNEVANVERYLLERKHKVVGILEQSKYELDNLLGEFSEGKFRFLINCGKLSEGIDVKNCSHIYIGRSIGSYTLLNQIIGRASRPDSNCNVWELVNPLSGNNLDSTAIVGTPERHRLIYKRGNDWIERDFDYTREDHL